MHKSVQIVFIEVCVCIHVYRQKQTGNSQIVQRIIFSLKTKLSAAVEMEFYSHYGFILCIFLYYTDIRNMKYNCIQREIIML